MHFRIAVPIFFFILLLQLFVKTVYADPSVFIGGELSLWCAYEENENGILQEDTNDEAAEITSGFNLKRGRVGFDYEDLQYHLDARLQIRLEERVDILDAYGAWGPVDWFRLAVGQMKIPSTYEVLTSGADLDFITRSTISGNIGDWSLSRTFSYSSFYGNESYYRDLGIAVSGLIGPRKKTELVKYFFMAGNGLGHSLYIGGSESKEFIVSNDFGDYFYGARLDLLPLDGITMGGHYSINEHDDMLFNDENTVFDLDRSSWSVDVRLDFTPVRIAGMYGAGVIDDDYFHTGLTNLEYSGWETKILYQLLSDQLELGARYDTYSYESQESGNTIDENHWTFGVNYIPAPLLRLQFNYIRKETEDDKNIELDLDDDIFFINFQLRFRTIDLLAARDY